MSETSNAIAPVKNKQVVNPEEKQKGVLTTTEPLMKAVMLLKLGKLGMQDIQKRINGLVYTRDNVDVIKSTIGEAEKLTNGHLNKIHEEEKKPAKVYGDICDKVKRDLFAELNKDMVTGAKEKYKKLTDDIAKEDLANKLEEERKDKIVKGIEHNVLLFSKAITDAKTVADVGKVERAIAEQLLNQNNKYAEYFPDAKGKFEKLQVLVSEQRKLVEEKIKIDNKLALATSKGNDEAALELMSKKEEIESKVSENKENIQGEAISAATSAPKPFFSGSYGSGGSYRHVPTKIKYKSRKWRYEVKNVASIQKMVPDYITCTVNDEFIEAKIKEMEAAGELNKDKTTEDMKDIFIFNDNVRIYLEKNV